MCDSALHRSRSQFFSQKVTGVDQGSLGWIYWLKMKMVAIKSCNVCIRAAELLKVSQGDPPRLGMWNEFYHLVVCTFSLYAININKLYCGPWARTLSGGRHSQIQSVRTWAWVWALQMSWLILYLSGPISLSKMGETITLNPLDCCEGQAVNEK